MSHVLFFVVLIALMFVSGKFVFQRDIYFGWYSKLFALLLLAVSSLATMGSAISKSKHVFFFGAMVEHGIVKTYLDDCCKFKSYKLCAYKDSLPDKAYKFIWDEKSPFYKIGGWKNTKQEFEDIIYETLTQPKYIALHIKESFKATILQLFLFSIGDGNGSFLEGTLLYERISKYFLKDLEIYSSSKQNRSSLSIVGYFNILFYGVVFLSLSLIIVFYIKYSSFFDYQIKVIFLILFLGIIINAWVCGTFANAIDRLGCKMIWLIPLSTIILSRKIYIESKKRSDAINDTCDRR
ncbi:MAG: hypothetical protein Fur0023_03730 [Bacteroidia bacterium]